jgi:hypothetical protein
MNECSDKREFRLNTECAMIFNLPQDVIFFSHSHDDVRAIYNDWWNIHSCQRQSSRIFHLANICIRQFLGDITTKYSYDENY